jgi:hypothetical protein
VFLLVALEAIEDAQPSSLAVAREGLQTTIPY